MKHNNTLIFDEYDYIEYAIDYEFDNEDLLFQAFTRKSYTEEHGRGLNNDNLEFLGDQVLSFLVTKYIMLRHGYIKGEPNNYESKIEDEGYFGLKEYSDAKALTNIKKSFVDNEMLAYRIDKLDFAKYLRVGKTDLLNDVINNTKVKGDLFEALVGAVCIDCNYDIPTLEKVVYQMLDIDYTMVHGFDIDRDDYRSAANEWYQKVSGENINYKIIHCADNTVKARAEIDILGDVVTYEGCGDNIEEAKKMCAKIIYRREVMADTNDGYVKEKLKKANLGEMITLNNAVSLLNFLYQEGVIKTPVYDIPEKPYSNDKNGNPIWKVHAEVKTINEGIVYIKDGYAYKMKEAKKIASYLIACELFEINPTIDENGKSTYNSGTFESDFDADEFMNKVVNDSIKRFNEENKNVYNVANINTTMALLETKAIEALKNNKDSIEVVSGDIQKELGLTNRCPSMCNAMRKFGNTSNLVKDYFVMSNPDIKNSSTYKIKYLLKVKN